MMNLDSDIFSSFNIFNSVTKLRSDVHIRTKQRKGKKCTTTIEGLATDLDIKKIAKALKKTFNTSASVVKIKTEHEDIYVIQIAGDKRTECQKFLLSTNIIDKDKDKLTMHGVE